MCGVPLHILDLIQHRPQYTIQPWCSFLRWRIGSIRINRYCLPFFYPWLIKHPFSGQLTREGETRFHICPRLVRRPLIVSWPTVISLPRSTSLIGVRVLTTSPTRDHTLSMSWSVAPSDCGRVGIVVFRSLRALWVHSHPLTWHFFSLGAFIPIRYASAMSNLFVSVSPFRVRLGFNL